MFTLKPYSPSLLSEWELVLESALNGTFLHSRSYMEYHKDKFVDASLIIYKRDKPVGIFPANRTGNEIHSHQGLTYGGPVFSPLLSMGEIFALVREVLRYYTDLGATMVHIKEVPSFYTSFSVEWMAYLMFILEASQNRMELTFVVSLPLLPDSYSKGRRWGIHKAKKNGLTVREVSDFGPFWEQVLGPNLWERHLVKPIHTLEEIQSLAERNSPWIRQFEILENDKIVAGATVFETRTTAHTQYISATRRGKELSALDLLIDNLMQKVFSHKAYFDFGTVNKKNGKKINKGLMEWKESFGAKPFVHLFYSIDPGKYGLIDGCLPPNPPSMLLS